MKQNKCENCNFASFEEDSNIQICTLGHKCINEDDDE